MERHFTLEELSAWLDGEAALTPSQQAHLRDCRECARVAGEQRALRDLARRAAPAIPTDAMWRKIEAGIGPGTGPAEAWTVRRPGVLERLWRGIAARPGPLALAGAAALAAAFMLLGRPVERRALFTPASPERVEAPAAAPRRKAAARPAPEPARTKAAAAREEDATESPRRERAARAEAPAVAAAPMRAAAATRASWRGHRVTIAAYRVDTPLPGYVVATGDVTVTPLDPATPWLARVDGLSRTLTGSWQGAVAEVSGAAQDLSLRTR